MCTTPGNAGAGFGYATWSFSGPTNANDNRVDQNSQGDQIATAGTISYAQVNNNQDQGHSPKIQIDVKPSKIQNSHRRTMFATIGADGIQHTPATTAAHHVHNQTGHSRSKKTSVAAVAAHDVFTLTHTCDKSGCNCDAHHTSAASASLFPNTLVFATDKHGGMSKHFMTPIGPLQLTAEECNEILMKRAAAASTQAVNSIASSQSDSHFSHVLTHVNTAQIDTKHNIKQQQDMNSQSSRNQVPKERPYTCTECGKSFLLKHHLTTHARVHTGERPHICVHCGKSFAHKHCLHTHLLLHSAERPYQCRECKKSFTLKHHLVTHTRVHTRERPFVCPECGKAFPLKRHLVTHSKFHTGERPFVCEECGESFAQKEHLTMHSRFHGSLHPFVCPDCGMSFQRKFELVNHGRLHGRIPHSCTVCGKEFLQKRTLLAHMRLHTGETPFACTVCGEAFPRKSDLIAHSKIHNSNNPESDTKPFTCRECGLEFNNREAQTLHLRLHSADRTLVTDLCGLAATFQPTTGHFLTANSTGTHQVIMNGPLSASNVSHMHGATQTSPPVGSGPKPKPHICPDCGRGFAQKHGLSQHQRRHTDGSCHIRSHVCDKCGKAFFQKNHLLLHQRQHMDPPPSIVRQQQRQAAQAAAQAAQGTVITIDGQACSPDTKMTLQAIQQQVQQQQNETKVITLQAIQQQHVDTKTISLQAIQNQQVESKTITLQAIQQQGIDTKAIALQAIQQVAQQQQRAQQQQAAQHQAAQQEVQRQVAAAHQEAAQRHQHQQQQAAQQEAHRQAHQAAQQAQQQACTVDNKAIQLNVTM